MTEATDRQKPAQDTRFATTLAEIANDCERLTR
jgi:hypothetical protein